MSALDLQDFEAMLNVYADGTRVWLGKTVRSPLLSILQDATLNLDLSTKTSSKGLASKFGALLALRAKQSSSASTARVDESKFVKLKVRARAIVDALVKAIEHRDVPPSVLEFWRRLTSDGVYFPESVRL